MKKFKQIKLKLFILLLLSMTIVTAFSCKKDVPKKTNVIFILADDLGWSDTELYGTTKYYKTPNINRLAERGMLFTRAYANSPFCSPTRASIMTGQTPLRHGSTMPEHHSYTEHKLRAKESPGAPAYQKATAPSTANRLDTAWPTLAKLIKAKGYATGHFGKWHLGMEPYSPLEHGFDVDIPHTPRPGPNRVYVGNWEYPNLKARHPKENIEDRMAEEAVNWMKTVKDQPFYMNYWAFSVHGPWDGHEHLVEHYKKTLDPNDEQRAPTYAAMVHTFDDAVGRLLDAVDELGIADHTAFVFTSDNGGNMYNLIDGGVPPTSNRPLRGGKGNEWDGGVRVPTAVVWPGVTEKGTRTEEVVQSCDFYPTILSLLDIPLPATWPVDGADITPALEGGTMDRDGVFIYFPHATVGIPDWLPPSIVLVSGDWKLTRLFHQGEAGEDELILSNFNDDPGEAENLVSKYPNKAQHLNRLIDEYLQSVDEKALPLRNPNFRINKYVPENRGVPLPDWKTPEGGVEGWLEGGSATLEKKIGYALLESTGTDPNLVSREIYWKTPLRGGPFKVLFAMKSTSEGLGEIYYQHTFNPKHTVEFAVKHDGLSHEYVVDVPDPVIAGFRIDPGTAPGRFEFSYIRFEDAAGNVVKEWRFN
jgi:arylsulfatase A-like enzyme